MRPGKWVATVPRAFSLLVTLMVWPLTLATEPYAKQAVSTRPLSGASSNEGADVSRQEQPVLSGAHTLQSSMTPLPFGPFRRARFLDAHDTPDKDFAVVTRVQQDNGLAEVCQTPLDELTNLEC
jgi:hypothetical protein